jgi:hypothetical protein
MMLVVLAFWLLSIGVAKLAGREMSEIAAMNKKDLAKKWREISTLNNQHSTMTMFMSKKT